jgi:Glycosyl transferase family 4
MLDDPASRQVDAQPVPRVGRLADAGRMPAAATLAPFQSHAAVFLGITNAVNLSDGLDGLAGGVTLLRCAALALRAPEVMTFVLHFDLICHRIFFVISSRCGQSSSILPLDIYEWAHGE